MLIFNLLIRFVLFLFYHLSWNGKLIQANLNEGSITGENTANNESKVNERILKLENKVAQLEVKGYEDGKVIHLLMGRIERLEASSNNATEECDCDEKAIRRLKCPVRLLPSIVLR